MFNSGFVIFAKAYLINRVYGGIYFSTINLHRKFARCKTDKDAASEISNPYHGVVVVKYYKTRDIIYFAMHHFLPPSATGTSSFVLAKNRDR